MPYTTQYYQYLYKELFLACIKDEATFIDAVKSRYNQSPSFDEIWQAFDEDGALKKPAANFIGDHNADRIKSFFTEDPHSSEKDPRDTKLCDRDRFILDAINFEVQSEIINQIFQHLDLLNTSPKESKLKNSCPDLYDYIQEKSQHENYNNMELSTKIMLFHSPYIQQQIATPCVNQIKIYSNSLVFSLTQDNQINLNANIFIEWQLSLFKRYENFVDSILPNNENLKQKFKNLKDKAQNDFNYLENESSTILEDIYTAIHSEGDQLDQIFNELPKTNPDLEEFVTEFYKKPSITNKIK